MSQLITVATQLPPKYLPAESLTSDTRPLLLEHLQMPESLLYTEKQARVFLAAKKALIRAERGLGVCGYAFIIIVPTIFTLFSAKVIDSNTNNILAMVFLGVIISNIASMILTGSLPDISSNNQNMDQNVMGELKDRFDKFGKYLLMEYTDSQKKEAIFQVCLKILNFLDSKEKNLLTVTTQKIESPDVTKFLRDTLRFIVTGHTSYNSDLEICLKSLSLNATEQLSTHKSAI
ncbi:MAG: hypothetical protein WCG10_01590 [Chlamydiota bacterium]